MANDEFLAREVLGHGAYVCLRWRAPGNVPTGPLAHLAELAERQGLRNEFDPAPPAPSRESIAFLRRHGAVAGQIGDDDLLAADGVIHVSSARAELVDEFCAEASRQLGAAARVRTMRGVVRPKNYTGAAMNNFAYARQVTQRPGPEMPNAFLVPVSKTAEWWRKDWMERHTYFLPRYDDTGRMVNQGHALAAEAGIACLLRRTYRSQTEPAPAGEYDFVSYFECADNDVPTFHAVCEALRDVDRNPEWRFVREGPTWHGRRVASWKDLAM